MKRLIFGQTFVILTLFAFYCADVMAQDAIISSATALPTTANPNHWQIYVGFDKDIDIPGTLRELETSPIKNTKNFHILEIETGQRISVLYVALDNATYYDSAGNLISAAGKPGEITVFLDPSIRLNPSYHYHLYVFNLSFEGSVNKNPAQRIVKINTPSLTPPNTQTQSEQSDPSKDSISFTAADGKEDSNIYLSGQFIAATKSRPNFSGDFKIEIPIQRVIGDRIHEFNPFLDLKVGHGPDVDPDSMKLGLKWEFPIWRYRSNDLQFPIRRIFLKNAPQLEAEKDWDNVNFVVDSRFRFMSRTYSNKFTTFYFRPFLGQEFGKNLKSLVSEANGRLIYRPLVGSTMNLIFPIQKAGLYDFSIEGEYTRRWLMKREITFQEADGGLFQPLEIGKGPRDYLSTKFTLNFTKYLGGTLSFERGKVPPSFKMVNNKLTIGLTYKVKID